MEKPALRWNLLGTNCKAGLFEYCLFSRSYLHFMQDPLGKIVPALGDIPLNMMEATKEDRFRVLPWPNNISVANLVEPVNKLNKKLLESINESENVYMSSTVVDGAYIIRCAIGATLTEERHGISAWKDPGSLTYRNHSEKFSNLEPMVDDRVIDIIKGPETYTFYMPHAEVTITLQDVEDLLRLPVDGKAITGSM
nr:tyrosine/dopa decarboxylase 5 [Quercus suber]